MTVRIEPFEARHARAVVDLILPIQQREFEVPVTLADQPDLQDVPGHYQSGGGGFWVALDTTRVVGSIGLLAYDDDEAALRKMFVHRDFRGRDKAVGQTLLQALLTHARASGLRRILLGTTPVMNAAHRFYEKNGFQRIAAEDLPPRFPRMAVDSRFYRLDL